MISTRDSIRKPSKPILRKWDKKLFNCASILDSKRCGRLKVRQQYAEEVANSVEMNLNNKK